MAQKPGHRLTLGHKLARWALEKAAAYSGATLSLTDPKGWGSLLGNSSAAGRTINDESAMQISAVWGCVRILAETIGSMPWAIYQKDGKGNSAQVDHPLTDVLINSPNSDMTSTEYREAMMTNLALRGNGYSLKEFNGAGNISSLYPIPAVDCKPLRKPDGTIAYKVLDRGRWDEYPSDKIFHLKGFGMNGLVGLSPLAAAREAMGLALATEEFGARFFSQGAKPSAVVSIPTWLKDDQREVARENIQKIWVGLENAQRVQLLEGGMTYTPVTMPLEDAQFILTRGMQIDEICRFYRMSPHMLAKLERATHNNIEQLSLEFVMYTLMPYMVRWEQAVSKRLMKPADRVTYYLRFNFEGMLRADTVTRGNFYAQMLQNGVYNRNEVRGLENLNRSTAPGMDDYTVQSNMALIQLLDMITRSQNPAPTGAQQ